MRDEDHVRPLREPDVEGVHLTTVTTKHLAEGIAADYDAEGRLAGIEIMDARTRLGDPDVFKQVILEDVTVAGS